MSEDRPGYVPVRTIRKDGSEHWSYGADPNRKPKHDQFEAGNKQAVTHGTRSDELVSKRAEEVAHLVEQKLAELSEWCPWIVRSDVEAVARYCRVEARAKMLDEFIADRVDRGGVEAVPAYLWGELTKAEQNAQKFGQDIGLDPAGRARLAKDLGWAKKLASETVGSLAETGRALRQARNG